MKKIFFAFFLLLTLLSLGSSALCEELQTLQLPARLKQIEDAAFYGDSSLQKVSVPDGTTHIGALAFANSSIQEVELPESIESIAPDAFSGCEGLVAYVMEGSYAEKYCNDAGFICKPLANPASDFVYQTTDDGTACIITRYQGTATDVIIPGTIEGKPVTTLGPELFSYYNRKKTITSVYLPDSIAIIEGSTFTSCTNLQKIRLPKGLKTIPDFGGCQNLEEIVWPENYTSFMGFQHCLKLKSFRIPDGMTKIPSSAFSGCSSLTGIYIPDGITSIPRYAFEGCHSLTDIHIPGSVSEIEAWAFRDCRNLKNVILSEGVKTLESHIFEDCTNLTSISLPISLESWNYGVFDNCPNLTIQVVGNSYAESRCLQLKLKHTVVGTINIDSLFETTVLEDGSCEITKFTGKHTYLKVPASIGGIPVSSIGNQAFYYSNVSNVFIPEGITHIGNSAFYMCTSLFEIQFPSTLQSIGTYAFGYTALTEATLPSGTTSLGNSIFYNCTSLTNVVLPTAITEIPNSAFYNCRKLESIEIPSGVTRIGSNAFWTCPLLQSPVFPEGLQEIDYRAFSGCNSIEIVVFPESLKKIGNEAFYHCTKIYLAAIPANVQEMGTNVFGGGATMPTVITERSCAGLEYCKNNQLLFILEPNPESDFTYKVINGDECMITGYRGTATDVFLPESINGYTITAVADTAFRGNKKITTFSALNSVIVYAYYTFQNCTALTNIQITDLVITFPENSIAGCTNLKSILVVGMAE